MTFPQLISVAGAVIVAAALFTGSPVVAFAAVALVATVLAADAWSAWLRSHDAQLQSEAARVEREGSVAKLRAEVDSLRLELRQQTVNQRR